MDFALLRHPFEPESWHFCMVINGKPWVSATKFKNPEAAVYMAKCVHGLRLAPEASAIEITMQCLHQMVLADLSKTATGVQVTPSTPIVPSPKELVICPKCDGTGRITYNLANDPSGSYKKITAGYDAQTDTIPCNNCGGQTMSGKAAGVVRVDPAMGQGCWHEFEGREAGRCYTIFTCKRCGTSFDIDSGD